MSQKFFSSSTILLTAGLPYPDYYEQWTPFKVFAYIEDTFGKIIDGIQVRPCGNPSIILKRITDVRPREDHGGTNFGLQIVDREMKISFPGKNQEEAWRFTCVVQILSEIYIAINAGIMITKRDIFYHDPELFKSQTFVDRYVDIIAYTCGVTRRDLNVTASPKGLVIGLHLGLNSCELVPDKTVAEIETILKKLPHTFRWNWILVVEKEATFKAIAEHQFRGGRDIIGLGIMITGKGYPDLATQRFLRACANHITRSECSTHLYHAQPPIFGLFDCDPDGINILDVYRHGSTNLSHESAYNVPQLIWLGLKPEDILHSLHNNTTALHLTKRDRTKAAAMLRRHSMINDRLGLGRECKTALHQMIMLNKKAEIQILDEGPEDMVKWLHRRIVGEMRRIA